jgi:hypothetical protein
MADRLAESGLSNQRDLDHIVRVDPTYLIWVIRAPPRASFLSVLLRMAASAHGTLIFTKFLNSTYAAGLYLTAMKLRQIGFHRGHDSTRGHDPDHRRPSPRPFWIALARF